SYRGGAVVYLNGKELTRAHMPKGEIKPGTPAEAYPKESYVDDKGVLLHAYRLPKGQEAPDGMKTRVRTLTHTVPAADLKKGVNVLAIELHRAPTSEIYLKAPKPEGKASRGVPWSLLGFHGAKLEGKGAGLSGSVPEGTLRVWAGNLLVDIWDTDDGEPCEKPVIPIAGARNGAFSGVVCIRSAKAIKGLTVDPSALKLVDGETSIPAKAIQVRYGVPGKAAPQDANRRHPKGATYLGVLAEKAPVEALVPEGMSGVTRSIWLTVSVPKDAKAGNYKGSVKIGAEGVTAVEVSLEISVADYVLPDRTEYVSCANLIQSPETTAIQYGVKMWSDEHWKLLDRTFERMAGVGCKVVYIHLIAQNNMGNEFSMVRWIKKEGGGWDHDFTVVEKYLDIAIKHLGKVPVVNLYTWTPTMGGGGFAKIVDKAKNDRPMHFTVLDPKTGEMTTEQGPDWGTPESVPFWQPVFDGVRKILADRGMEKSMAIGMGSDRVPSKQALDDLNKVAPEAGWVIHAHGKYTSFAGKPVSLDASVWGVKGPYVSTYRRYKPGWQNKNIMTVFPRYGAGNMGHVRHVSPIGVFHASVESYQAGGYNGLGRVAADLWPVIKAKRGQTSILSRFPSWQRPGVPTMGHGEFLHPAEEGPVAGVRFEALRLGVQECEARIFIEKPLYDKAKKAALGEELAGRSRKHLDTRVEELIRAKQDRSVMYSIATDASWLGYAAEFSDRARRLYALASEVQVKLPTSAPVQ
ncbi:glycoside hydrolase domain-containing protein, partial [Planctomycetota bacterium]